MNPFYRDSVVVRLVGGFGNQLFQVAHALGLKKLGYQVACDVSWFHRRPDSDTIRHLEVDPSLSGLRVTRLPTWLWSPRAHITYREGGPAPQPAWPMGRILPRLESGYWQSWASVNAVRQPMSDFLQLTMVSQKVAQPIRSNHVAVHVRLGDYLIPRASDFHGVTDPHTQLDLARHMAKTVGTERIRVFTDSPELLPDEFERDPGIELDDSTTSLEAMIRMASASALVMSNSSLSWWAATYANWCHGTEIPVGIPVPWLRHPSPLDDQLRAPNWTVFHRKLLADT